jgi:hypothetical protein
MSRRYRWAPVVDVARRPEHVRSAIGALADTLRDVLAWEETQPEHPHSAGLSDAEERDLPRLVVAS